MADLRYLPVSSIDPNPFQPRRRMAGLEELANSIREKGLLEPVMVRPAGDRWQLLHGERRWRAAQMAGLKEIPAIVREATDAEAREIALLENLQRHDLTPMEEAEAFRALQDAGWTQERIAQLVGKTQSYVAHKLRLLRMPAPLTFYLQEGLITENHLRQIATLEGIYGPDLLRPFEDLSGYPWGDPEGAAFALLRDIRPEDKPVAHPLPPSPVMVAACARFAEYVLQHDGTVPQWVVAGFWWASLVVKRDLSVANLALLLRAWRERFEYALLWWTLIGKHKHWREFPDPDDQGLWFDYQSDLRHSGALELAENLPDDRLLAIFERIGRLDFWVLPSIYQHGGKPVPEKWLVREGAEDDEDL